MLLLLCLLVSCGTILGASINPASPVTSPPPGDPPPAALSPREGRSGRVSDTAWWSAPEPKWLSRQLHPSPQASSLGTRGVRFVAGGVGDYQPAAAGDLARDYRYEPYYRQELAAYDRTRDRDFYDSPRYIDFNSPRATVPRRIIYYDDLGSRTKTPYYQQPQQFQQYQQQPANYDNYGRFSSVRSPNIGVSPYRYNPQDQGGRGVNSIVSEGTVESAPLLDDPYRSYNPRQPAPWSVQVGTSLTVKDDDRHGGAGRRYYVQSQREEPSLGRSLGLSNAPRAGGRLWAELQPRV